MQVLRPAGGLRKMWAKEKKEGVSAVIAVILMVAITVVLAGVLYMWVMQMAQTGGGGQVSIGVTKEVSGNYYLLSVASVQGSAEISSSTLQVKRAGSVIISDDFSGVSDSAPTGSVYALYEGPSGYINITDNNKDGYITGGDTISLYKGAVNTGDILEIKIGSDVYRITEI